MRFLSPFLLNFQGKKTFIHTPHTTTKSIHIAVSFSLYIAPQSIFCSIVKDPLHEIEINTERRSYKTTHQKVSIAERDLVKRVGEFNDIEIKYNIHGIDSK